MRALFDHPRSAPSSLLALLPLTLLIAAACSPVVITGPGEGSGGASSSTGTSADGGRGGGGPWATSTVASTSGDATTTASGGWTTSTAGGVTTTTTASGGWTTSTTSGGGSACADPTDEALPPGQCAPVASACGGATSVCLATVDADAAPTFGLRVAHLGMTAPAALTHGAVGSIFESYTEDNLEACNLDGDGYFNWLLRFDTAAGTVTTGAARPITDPATGYAFIDETLTLGGGTFTVAPLTLAAPVDAACGLTSAAGDVTLPFFGDTEGSLMTLFPLRSLRFFDTQVTPDHNCIGAFASAGLGPSGACLDGNGIAPFLDGGHLEALISLEEADKVLVPVLEQTLCVLLTDNAGMFSVSGGSGVQECKRTAGGAIVFQGDWCAATNAPATAGCADAMHFAASFAASGTKID